MSTFSNILIPLDGSHLAEGVLPHALALSNVDSHLTVARVLQIGNDENHNKPVNPLEWQIQHAEVQAYLEKIVATLRASGQKNVSQAILEGEPAQQIVEYAKNNAADLILLSSHGKSGVSRWNVSSVVRKIAQAANTSTVITRAYQFPTANPAEEQSSETPLISARYQRILVPLDGSVRSEVSLPRAAALAQKHGATLVLAHIIMRPELIQRIPVTGGDRELVERLSDRAHEIAERYLEQLRSRLPVDFVTVLRDNSDVIHTIQQVIEDQNVDLLVLSAHGHSADPSRTYGNITSGLIEYGSVPTLIIQDLSAEEMAPTRAEEAAREHKGHA